MKMEFDGKETLWVILGIPLMSGIIMAAGFLLPRLTPSRPDETHNRLNVRTEPLHLDLNITPHVQSSTLALEITPQAMPLNLAVTPHTTPLDLEITPHAKTLDLAVTVNPVPRAMDTSAGLPVTAPNPPPATAPAEPVKPQTEVDLPPPRNLKP